ncbi:alpha/beta fold hydrolase [Flavobacterium jejuense]|uniref:Alpha/beta fold hydrolase n=1 Tax=Flavobacterium jejuense TaxID=1544455 RepID=A0ABX0IKE5_9FLAO|nr:alpha/beta fold hydrolase [Flavobacterium jejuense]NHN24188.1 alpha/beta fold hydrolase [Flavobacterium jejuense]
MPFINNSSYDESVSFLHKHKHVSTIYAGMFKKFPAPIYKREILELQDGDFLAIDYNLKNSTKAIILCHGLEGNSQRTYMNSCATYFLERNFSVFAWNNRSCSGEMNRLPRLYHHAAIEDLDAVIQFALTKVDEIYLIGYSMGGAQTLNYLGSNKVINKRIKAAIAVSVPIEVKSSAESLKKGFNKVYMKNFTNDLIPKLKYKAQQFPELLNWDKIKDIKNFDDLDDNFTAPLHGFKNREDYYFKVSPARNIENIIVPVLIINALDDPFLGEDCYPVALAKKNSFIHLEIPKYGGHCAFPMKNNSHSYAEIRAFAFIETLHSVR